MINKLRKIINQRQQNVSDTITHFPALFDAELKNKLNNNEIVQLQELAIKERDLLLIFNICKFLYDKEFNTNMEKYVYGRKQPHWWYMFALEVPHADIRTIENKFLSIKPNNYTVYFTLNIPNVNFEKLQKHIIQNANIHDLVQFANNGHTKFNLNVEALENNVFAQSGNIEYFVSFTRNVKGVNVNKCIQAILRDVELWGNEWLRYLLQIIDIKGADIKLIKKSIINSNDVSLMIQLANRCNSVETDYIQKCVIKTNDYDIISEYNELECADNNILEPILEKIMEEYNE